MAEEYHTLSPKKYKIGIDTRSLANLEKSGVEGYVQDLTHNLPKTDASIEWYFFVDGRGRKLKATSPAVHFVHIPFTREPWFWPVVKLFCRINGLDLFHFPIALIPENFPVPGVITIYDLASEVYPQFYSAEELEIHKRQVTASVQTKAAGILAISESTKADLVKYYSADPAKIFVTLLSPVIDTSGTTAASPHDFKYALCVGNIQPRKNFVNAVLVLAEQPDKELHLIMAGKYQDEDELAKINRAAQDAGVTDRVHITGYISRQELNNLYKHAEALLYPSFYEGFGIPLLEAFSFNIPVVTTKASSMPEIAGEAAEYCDPSSTDSIAKAIQAATKPDRKKTLVALGNQRLVELAKTTLAQSTLKAYINIINGLK